MRIASNSTSPRSPRWRATLRASVAARVLVACAALGAVAGCGATPAPSPPASRAPIDATVEATAWPAPLGWVRRGERVSISARGSWSMWAGHAPFVGPEGGATPFDGCPHGGLVATIGLAASARKRCIGASSTFVADRDGFVYVASNDGRREDNVGAMSVHAEGAAYAPMLPMSMLGAFDPRLATTPEIEVASRHTIWLLPVEIVARHGSDGVAGLARLDAMYELHAELAGSAPFGGAPIRFAIDDELVTRLGAYMVSGNPIRVASSAVWKEAVPLALHHPGQDNWGYPHEMGHDFADAVYIVGGGPAEAWANVFTMHAFERLGLSGLVTAEPCKARDRYLASGSYAELRDDAWLPLCMLMELRARHGWPLFARFFRAVANDRATAPDTGAPDAERWAWIARKLSESAGEDVRPTLARWRVPVAAR